MLIKNRKMLVMTIAAIILAVLLWFLPLAIKGIEASSKPESALQARHILPANNSAEKIRLPILMYHHIRDYRNPSDPLGERLSISPRIFAAQLDELIRLGYQTATFEELSSGKLPDKPIIITLDDSYDDVFSEALPELSKRNMKAVSFVIVDRLGTPGYMTAEQVKEISNKGIEIGSHTLTHPMLSSSSPAKQEKEITGSKAKLENILNSKIISFCYPYGNFNGRTISYVESAGYEYAVTTVSGEGDSSSPYIMKRIRVPDRPDIEKIFKDFQIIGKKH